MDGTILHVDMDAFFASVELSDRPELRGQPVIVGGGERGVVLAATYEARAFGVHAGQSSAQAHRLCPQAVFLRPQHHRYRDVSRDVMDLFHQVTPLVEQISVDEAFLDVSGARRRLGAPLGIAEWLRAEVRRRHRITCSVGIATNKSVAKIASGRAKPDGVMVVPAGGEQEFLAPLPVGVMWGVGAKTAEVLARWGIETVGDLAAMDRETLARAVGKASGYHLYELAHGRDPRPVTLERHEKSLSAETTFERDTSDPAELRRHLLTLSLRCGERLRASGQAGRVVGIKVRTSDFATLQRSKSLDVPTDVTRDVFAAACELLAGVDLGHLPVRLLGVKVDSLADYGSTPVQGTFDESADDARAADVAADKVRNRFGRHMVSVATLLTHASTSPKAARDLS